METVVITIDGPAGAGKSTVARGLADRLGYGFLDTGAMYRAVALAAMQRGIDLADDSALAAVAQDAAIELRGDRVLLDGQDVTAEIRSPEVTANTRHAADNPRVRALLVDRQRQIVAGGRWVSEGRDQGTVAFPQAACKFFVTASPLERARRRQAELSERGQDVSLDVLLAQQSHRDEQDAARPVGALVAAADATHVVTDSLSVEQVIDALEATARRRLDARGE
jgi:cytidylate kinase